METKEIIKTRKRKGRIQYALFSKDGEKRLGRWGSKASAEKREKEVRYFKQQNK